MCLSWKRSSTNWRSPLGRPAWWMAKEYPSTSCDNVHSHKKNDISSSSSSSKHKITERHIGAIGGAPTAGLRAGTTEPFSVKLGSPSVVAYSPINSISSRQPIATTVNIGNTPRALDRKSVQLARPTKSPGMVRSRPVASFSFFFAPDGWYAYVGSSTTPTPTNTTTRETTTAAAATILTAAAAETTTTG